MQQQSALTVLELLEIGKFFSGREFLKSFPLWLVCETQLKSGALKLISNTHYGRIARPISAALE